MPTKAFPLSGCVLAACVCAVVLSHSAGANTAVVVVWHKSAVLMAADSKVTNTNPTLPSYPVCKIRHLGNGVFLTGAGLFTRDTVGTEELDVFRIAARAAERGGSVESIASAFENLVYGPLTRAAVHLRKNFPGRYKESERGMILEVVFAGWDEGPVVVRKKFTPISDGMGEMRLNVTTTVCPRDCSGPPNQLQLILIGEIQAMEPLASMPGWDKPNISEGLRRLIEAAISANPDEAGPPIDILFLDPEGPRWIDVKPGCSSPH